MRQFLLMLISIYQKIISPLLPARCRYYPTCSTYGRQALQWWGVGKGMYLLVKRILRCHPWGGSGIDFVPLPLEREVFYLTSLRFSGVKPDTASYRSRLNHLIR